MQNNTSENSENLFSKLLELKTDSESIFLVGGAVRDLLMNTPSHDFDFVVCGNVRRLARRTADRLGGVFYMLDDERETARVILKDSELSETVLDFAALRADDLNGDLQARDFTINAMAMDVSNREKIIDPLGGMSHLRQRILVACSPQAFENDALRVIRAVRLAVGLDFHIESQTLQALKAGVALLKDVSAERIRDELFRILGASRMHTAIRILDQVGAIPFIFPDLVKLKDVKQSAPHTLDVWQHSLATLRDLETLLDAVIDSADDNAGGKSLYLGMAMLGLRTYRPQMTAYFTETLSAHRTRRQLLALAALYHDIAKPETINISDGGKISFHQHELIGAQKSAQMSRALALSDVEARYLENMVRQHMRIHHLASSDCAPDRRSIHRFFRACGDAGVSLCFLTLADLMGTYENTLDEAVWKREVEICRQLLFSWWEETDTVIYPRRLLNGDEIMAAFEQKPGPLIGQVLLSLSEAQAAGDVTDREAALAFVSAWFENKKLERRL